MSITVSPLVPSDRPHWEQLARGYRAFYKTETTDSEYEAAWSRLMAHDGVHGLGAKRAGELVGIAHYLFHTSTWARTVCYLQDLFTSPQARGTGVASALIAAVAQKAVSEGAVRYYWLTQEQNDAARKLYEQVAKFNGFIRYDHALKRDA
jgi:GNAT superfamily N-acetyltransferase